MRVKLLSPLSLLSVCCLAAGMGHSIVVLRLNLNLSNFYASSALQAAFVGARGGAHFFDDRTHMCGCTTGCVNLHFADLNDGVPMAELCATLS